MIKFSWAFRHNLALTFLVLLCGAITACANVDITKTSSSYYDPTDPNTIEVLKTHPSRNYEELGDFTVTNFDVSETAKMNNAIRAKASELGANAVIITQEGLVPAGFGEYRRWASGVAIRFTPNAKSKAKGHSKPNSAPE